MAKEEKTSATGGTLAVVIPHSELRIPPSATGGGRYGLTPDPLAPDPWSLRSPSGTIVARRPMMSMRDRLSMDHPCLLADKVIMSDSEQACPAMRDGHDLDVVSSAEGDSPSPNTGSEVVGRRWLGIHFECCRVYSRVYREPDDTHYEGRCPRCGRSLRIGVGPDGVNARVLRARVVHSGRVVRV